MALKPPATRPDATINPINNDKVRLPGRNLCKESGDRSEASRAATRDCCHAGPTSATDGVEDVARAQVAPLLRVR
jgi:hypothetical protein